MLKRLIGIEKIFLLVGTMVGISIYFELMSGKWASIIATMLMLMLGIYAAYVSSDRSTTYKKVEDLVAGVINSLAIIAILQAF